MTESRPSPTKDRDGETILDIRTYAPFLLNAVSSAWQRKTSAIYRAEFGFGITEWRVIAMLNIEPDITANRICDVIRMDKAAVSRSLQTLADAGLARFDAPDHAPRKRRWSLTADGQVTHGRILGIALEHESAMLEGINAADLETTLSVLRHMIANLDGQAG